VVTASTIFEAVPKHKYACHIYPRAPAEEELPPSDEARFIIQQYVDALVESVRGSEDRRWS
jgi:hypothetical protein